MYIPGRRTVITGRNWLRAIKGTHTVYFSSSLYIIYTHIVYPYGLHALLGEERAFAYFVVSVY